MSATLTVNAASGYSFTTLVSDSGGTGAVTTDANLVNPWGIVFPLVGRPGSRTTTPRPRRCTTANGKAQPLSAPSGSWQLPPGQRTFDPTGIVFKPFFSDFVVSSGATLQRSPIHLRGRGGHDRRLVKQQWIPMP